MRKRTKEDGYVDVDQSSKTLGLEDYLRPNADPVVRAEHHKAGEKCLHWLRLPNGAIGFMDPAHVKRAPCRWCMGGGILLGNLTLNKRAGSGTWVTADDLKSMEYARQHFVPRRVA